MDGHPRLVNSAAAAAAAAGDQSAETVGNKMARDGGNKQQKQYNPKLVKTFPHPVSIAAGFPRQGVFTARSHPGHIQVTSRSHLGHIQVMGITTKSARPEEFSYINILNVLTAGFPQAVCLIFT